MEVIIRLVTRHSDRCHQSPTQPRGTLNKNDKMSTKSGGKCRRYVLRTNSISQLFYNRKEGKFWLAVSESKFSTVEELVSINTNICASQVS